MLLLLRMGRMAGSQVADSVCWLGMGVVYGLWVVDLGRLAVMRLLQVMGKATVLLLLLLLRMMLWRPMLDVTESWELGGHVWLVLLVTIFLSLAVVC